MPFNQIFEVGLRTPPLPQTPYNVALAYEKGRKWKSVFHFFSGQNVFQPKKNTKDI